MDWFLGFYNYRIVIQYLPEFGRGLWATIWISAIAMVMALSLGTVVAIMRMSANPISWRIAAGYVQAIRSTPLLVQIYVIYFALPPLPLLGRRLDEIEGVEEHRGLRRGAQDLALVLEVHALLQPLEGRAARGVECHDLAVEQRAGQRLRSQLAREQRTVSDFGMRIEGKVSAEQRDPLAFLVGAHVDECIRRQAGVELLLPPVQRFSEQRLAVPIQDVEDFEGNGHRLA